MAPPKPSLAPQDETRRGLLIVSGLFSALLWAVYFYGLHLQHGYLFDEGPLLVGRDFLNFWMVGKTFWLAKPGPWYDFLDYSRQLRAFLGPDYPYQQWSYPPTLMLPAAPFGLLPYGWALAAWLSLQAALMGWLWRRFPGDAALLLVSPALLMALVSGQASFFFLGLLIVIFENLERHPVKAGCLLGCFGFKPQLVMTLPLALLAEGRWRVLITAALVSVGMAVAILLFFGPEPWLAYLQHGLPDQGQVAKHPPPNIAALMPTLFVELHRMHWPNIWCNLVQGALSLAASGLLWHGFRRSRGKRDRPLVQRQRFALFAAVSVLASPYWMSYDLLILTWAVIRLLGGGPWPRPRLWLCAVLYFLPACCLILHSFRIPGIPVPMLLFAWWMHRELVRPDHETAPV